MRDKPTEFTECDTCRAKPGSPLLCSGCLANRELIGRLQKLVAPVGLSEARERFTEWLGVKLGTSYSEDRRIANKAAELFGAEHARLKRELDAAVHHHSHNMSKIDLALGEPRYDDCSLLDCFLRRIAELKDPSPADYSNATAVDFEVGSFDFAPQQITDLKATIARLEGEVAKLTKDLEREERDHLGTIDHRDQHEERINQIVGCLGLGEYESSWTSHNDPSDRAIEAIEELQRRLEALQPEIIIGKGQAVTREGVYAALADDADATDTWDCCPKEVGEQFCEHNRYIYIGPIPTFPPRLTEAAKIIQHNTRDDEAMQLIRAERQRQISAEGWSADHDEAHHNGELEDAALCYWHCATKPGHVIRVLENNSDTKWPWESRWFKPFKPSRGEFPEVDNVRCLVKAGALMLAEIDRLKRTGAEVHCGYGQQVWDIAADLAKLLPPRPTFTPPPKPDTLIRHKALADPCWAYRDGTGFRTGDGKWWDSSEVELLDETTGEVRG